MHSPKKEVEGIISKILKWWFLVGTLLYRVSHDSVLIIW